ncbi:MAG: DUF1080 domain-containing protein [Planctomycetota bacterium]
MQRAKQCNLFFYPGYRRWMLFLFLLSYGATNLAAAPKYLPVCIQESGLNSETAATDAIAGSENTAQSEVDDSDFAPDQSAETVPAPEDAIVLFDAERGINLFRNKLGGSTDWNVAGDLMEVVSGNSNHIVSMVHFQDADIHVEFMTVDAENCNSGIYVHGNYELQIMNSVNKELSNHTMGAVYGFHQPLVNADRGPGQWQIADIRYRAPVRNEEGEVVREGSITAWMNGQKVQENARFAEPRSTYHPFRFRTTDFLREIWEQQKATSTGPVFLQDHDHPVKFRNVWIRPLDEHAFFYADSFAEEGFESIIASDSIDDWAVREGAMVTRVQDGEITVGWNDSGEGGILCVPGSRTDFILEAEFMPMGCRPCFVFRAGFDRSSTPGNSPVVPPIQSFEQRISTGSDDLDSLVNPVRDQRWNLIRIECSGEKILYTINGGKAVEIADANPQTGFIGFELPRTSHEESYGEPAVKFRNIRIKGL